MASTKSIFQTLGVPTKPQATKGLLAFQDNDILEELKRRGLRVENISEEASVPEEGADVPQPFLGVP